VKSAARTNRISLRIVATVAALLGGCGYHFAASGSGLPSNAATIYVARFSNKSRITGLDDQFARYLKDEIASHKRLQVIDDPAQADLLLSGVIVSAEEHPTTFNSVDEPTQFQEQFVVNADLTDNRSNKVIWSAQRMTAAEFYAATPPAVVTTSPEFLQQNLRQRDINRLPDMQLAQTQREAGQDQFLTTMAHNLYTTMAEGF
jgi:hypothetical protein